MATRRATPDLVPFRRPRLRFAQLAHPVVNRLASLDAQWRPSGDRGYWKRPRPCCRRLARVSSLRRRGRRHRVANGARCGRADRAPSADHPRARPCHRRVTPLDLARRGRSVDLAVTGPCSRAGLPGALPGSNGAHGFPCGEAKHMTASSCLNYATVGSSRRPTTFRHRTSTGRAGRHAVPHGGAERGPSGAGFASCSVGGSDPLWSLLSTSFRDAIDVPPPTTRRALSDTGLDARGCALTAIDRGTFRTQKIDRRLIRRGIDPQRHPEAGSRRRGRTSAAQRSEHAPRGPIPRGRRGDHGNAAPRRHAGRRPFVASERSWDDR